MCLLFSLSVSQPIFLYPKIPVCLPKCSICWRVNVNYGSISSEKNLLTKEKKKKFVYTYKTKTESSPHGTTFKLLLCFPANPPFKAYPAVIGAAIGGMILATLSTVLLFIFVLRKCNNYSREWHSETKLYKLYH